MPIIYCRELVSLASALFLVAYKETRHRLTERTKTVDIIRRKSLGLDALERSSKAELVWVITILIDWLVHAIPSAVFTC